jgi:integrase
LTKYLCLNGQILTFTNNYPFIYAEFQFDSPSGFVLYNLHHSCATLLLSADENPKIVAERLEHSGVKMTLDTYSHVLLDMQKSANR